MFKIATLFAVLGTSVAEMLYLSQMPGSIPGNYSIHSFDTDSQKLALVATGAESSYTAYSFVSGAAACGNRYYSVAVDVGINWGLQVADISTGKSQIFNTDDLKNKRVYHAIYCTEETNTVVTVQASLETSPPSYGVWKVTVDDNFKVTQKHVGDFGTDGASSPVGCDQEFAATFAATGKIYAVFSTSNFKGGSLKIMDMSGKVETYKYDGSPYPVQATPLKNDGTPFTTIFKDVQNGKFSQASCTLGGSAVKTTGEKAAPELAQIGGMPWSYSPKTNKFYAISSMTYPVNAQTLYVANAATLAIEQSFDINSFLGAQANVGGVAVAQ
jgi:hypothetical protein